MTVELTKGETNGADYVFEAVTPPGSGVPPHVHQHEHGVIHMLEGEYEFMLDGQTHRATAGALVIFPHHIPHAFTNVGQAAGRTLWTIIPCAGFEQFFEEPGALPAGPPDIFKKYDIESTA